MPYVLDCFLAFKELPDRSSVTTSKKAKKQGPEETSIRAGIQSAGAWPPEVSVTRVAWNNGCGLARAPLLASATASGLCRVDWLLGHFQDDRIPYGGVQQIRFEINSLDKVDNSDDD